MQKTLEKHWFLMPRLEKPKENQCFGEAPGSGNHGFEVSGPGQEPGPKGQGQGPRAQGPRPTLPQTSRARNIFDHFWSKFDQNLTKFDQAGMSKFWGLLFFCGKNRRRPPGLGTLVLCTIHLWLGLLAWPWLAWLSSPRTGLARLACTSNNDRGAGNRAAGAKGGRRPTLSVILGWAPSGAQPKITQGGRRPT